MLDAIRLRVLVAIARHGSVTAAAHALNYAQPSISHHMARLEAETGVKLMERAGRGVRLTAAGQLLAGRAEEILGRLDAAEAELAAHVGMRPSQIGLAAFGSAMSTVVADAAAAMRADLPGVSLVLTQAEPAEALRMLRTSQVDVALTYRYLRRSGDPDALRQPADDGLQRRLILDEPVYLITPAARDGSSQRAPADVGVLAGHAGQRWIAGDDTHRDFLSSLCRSAGFVPDIAAGSVAPAGTLALVHAGLGIAIAPGLALRAAQGSGSKIQATEIRGARRQIEAASRGGLADPTPVGQLIDALIRAAAVVEEPVAVS
jgi:DNA-binding transcriptional LysR family regulator